MSGQLHASQVVVLCRTANDMSRRGDSAQAVTLRAAFSGQRRLARSGSHCIGLTGMAVILDQGA